MEFDDDMPPDLEDFTEDLEKIKGYRGIHFKSKSLYLKMQKQMEKKMKKVKKE